MKLFELTIEDNTDEIFAISVVENPAIQENFLYFNEQKEKLNFAKIDNEERKLVGPILIPDLRILRVDESDNSTYEVFFSKKTVAQLAQNYLKKKYVDKATLEHDKKIKGLTLVESWIKENKTMDKSNLYGLNMPVGTWMGVFQIDRTPEGDKLWNDYVKTGKVKGFSVEALLSHKLVKASADEVLLSKEITELSEYEAQAVLNKLRYLIKSDKRYKAKKRMDVQDMEGVAPTISSSYPGQAAGYVSPATLDPKTLGIKKKMRTKIFK